MSERLGHASVAITLDRYSHVLPSMQRDAAEVLGRALWGVIHFPIVASDVARLTPMRKRTFAPAGLVTARVGAVAHFQPSPCYQMPARVMR